MTRLPPLGALRAFDAAARLLNFRLAAEELAVTHGAVAQQVRALEANLGVMLFERGPRGLSLTQEGHAFHPPIRRAFALIATASASFDTGRRAGGRACVTVTVTPSFAAKWLIPRLAKFSTEFPEIEVRILASEQLEPLGSKGTSDLAVRLTDGPFDRALDATLLMPICLFPICNPSVAAQLHSPDDLEHATLLHDSHDLWPLWLERAGSSIRGRSGIRFNQSSLALDAALDGQGVALSPAPLVQDDLSRGLLMAPFGTELFIESERSFYIVMPKHARPEAVCFRDWLLRAADVTEL
ncbi:LysR family glycine cleavage system transcriptional activator [Rhodoligotrophos appendicifer]|uniref:LysR substrate-binding domain-containing protein n=1 Tax=Rhodoligotrophos appendicifer TaxID=987056 RepID=UPI00117FDD6B|nr:LysR substrate-binding domain-containing protein [Rhodoligotrophos appendicifer]